MSEEWKTERVTWRRGARFGVLLGGACGSFGTSAVQAAIAGHWLMAIIAAIAAASGLLLAGFIALPDDI